MQMVVFLEGQCLFDMQNTKYMMSLGRRGWGEVEDERGKVVVVVGAGGWV